jgi:FK506-binding nuclear protein
MAAQPPPKFKIGVPKFTIAQLQTKNHHQNNDPNLKRMSRRRRQDEDGDGLVDQIFQKKLKTNGNSGTSEAATLTEVSVAEVGEQLGPPKSRKELRAEKKASKKAASMSGSNEVSEEDQHIEKIRLRKERRKEALKEQMKEQRKQNKLRKVKKLHKEMNAPGGVKAVQAKKVKDKEKKQEQKSPPQDLDMLDVFKKVYNGSTDGATGVTTLRLGVQYKDTIVGTGKMVKDLTVVTVKYKLTGGKFGAVLDSSNNFTFLLGKGEVIQGWDIGLLGMRQGGERRLIIPPKAGYGSKDIGAGAGATLNFDITLLKC